MSISLFSFLGVVEAQRATFSAMDVFTIPSVNGSVRFSVDGSYASAVLDNDTWVFTNLTLGGSRVSGNLKFSAKDCNVIINSFAPSRNTANGSFSSCYIRYTVEGVGEQVINLGLNSSKPSHHSEWMVLTQADMVYGEGKVWKLLPDNSVIVSGLLGNVTVMRYGSSVYSVDDRAFYLRHSVSITTGIILAITVAVTSVIRVRSEKRKGQRVVFE